MTIARLKSVGIETPPGGVTVHRRTLERVHLDDPEGSVTALLRLLRKGTRTEPELVEDLALAGHSVTGDELAAVLAQLDAWQLLERADGDDALEPAVRVRHQSNLRFYDVTSNLEFSSADQHQAVAAANILLLGAGGLGSGILQSLVGLGVGRITLVDFDTVEPKNLNRQFTYDLASVGRRKVDAAKAWVDAYSEGTVVTPVHRRITDAATIQELATGADLVVGAIDSPDNVQVLLNDACFALGIPFVVGGLAYSTLSYWSVEPGSSPCRQCLELHRDDEPGEAQDELLFDPGQVNRATGPVVQLLSGLITMEVMRYLRPTEMPLAQARYHVVELADGMTVSFDPWQRHPDCKYCASLPAAAG
jgi:molybdopterin/thiamine biosynthesis adenylyltransferase